jgi:hypothetical protein
MRRSVPVCNVYVSVCMRERVCVLGGCGCVRESVCVSDVGSGGVRGWVGVMVDEESRGCLCVTTVCKGGESE